MADSSLDSFFAKKDKTKKAKSKGKSVTSDQSSLGQTKRGDESFRKNEKTAKKDKDKSNAGSNGGNSNNLISDFEKPNEEWKEVEDEQEKDYSGLRIQSLSLADKEKEDEMNRDQLNQDGEGDDSRNNEGPQGPWKISSGGITDKDEDEELDEPEEPLPEEAPSAPKGYVPPHMRNQQNNQPSYTQRKYGKPIVPEMDSDIHFPTLASVSESDKKGIKIDDRSFQSVTRGSKSRDDVNLGAVKVETGNKYSALGRRDYGH